MTDIIFLIGPFVFIACSLGQIAAELSEMNEITRDRLDEEYAESRRAKSTKTRC